MDFFCHAMTHFHYFYPLSLLRPAAPSPTEWRVSIEPQATVAKQTKILSLWLPASHSQYLFHIIWVYSAISNRGLGVQIWRSGQCRESCSCRAHNKNKTLETLYSLGWLYSMSISLLFFWVSLADSPNTKNAKNNISQLMVTLDV